MRRPLFESLVRGLGQLLASLLYRVKAFGLEHLPRGGFLLLPNHLTWVDAVVLQLACPRQIRFVVDAEIYKIPTLNPILRAVGCLPISSRRAKDAVEAATEAIQAGEIVCIFPEGELSRSGMLLRLKRGYELIARQAKAPVVPVWLDGLWGSIFSFKGGKFFFKWPRSIPFHAAVAFGEAIPAEEADTALVRERFLELSEFCFQQRPELTDHLGRACIRGLKREQFGTAVIEGTDESKLTRGSLLAAAIALSFDLREFCTGPRIGIVLPPGKGAIIANLAAVLAGKTPVNFNFTAGRPALEAAHRLSGVAVCLTAKLVERKLQDFPWPATLLRIEELLPRQKSQIILWRVAVALLPAWALASLLGVPAIGDRDEAVLLFTSGSSGEPKGVVLSHRNLLGNVLQFSSMIDLGRGDLLLACLPFFHSFGCTVTLWFPLIDGIQAVTYPSPLELAKNAELIHKYGVSLLCTTPTFLRGYLRKVEPEQLKTLKLLVTGAEKLPQELADAFHEKFQQDVLQGYGLTETSPVAAVNLPERPHYRPDDSPQPSSRKGSVGRLAPGMAAQIRDPDTDKKLSLYDTGMLYLKGPNIFECYLNAPERTREVLQEGWFKTGDLGRFDEDGFLFIEGRLSRFSKIGGEMVPHETIESRIYEIMGLPKEERVVVVTGVPDQAKGEALVLLASRDLDFGDLKTKLTDAGLPNLWIPRKLKRVEAVPMLASGKLDLQKCKELALVE